MPTLTPELRKTTEHATDSLIGPEFLHGIAPEHLATFNAHLRHYAAPNKEQECAACGTRYSFQWGLQYGEGHCYECGWPATLYHFVKDDHGNDLFVIRGLLLWYHPDEISATPPRQECER